ncbi:MAG: hypothetical protein ACK55Z_02565 [bacterium]
MLIHRPHALTAVRARRIMIWGIVALALQVMQKVADYCFSLPDSACASAFDTRSFSFLLLLFALDVHMKGRSILSGLRAEGD